MSRCGGGGRPRLSPPRHQPPLRPRTRSRGPLKGTRPATRAPTFLLPRPRSSSDRYAACAQPCVPFADTALSPTVAPWLQQMPTPDLRVTFTPAAEAQLEALAPALRLLAGREQARTAIEEVLIADPRSVHWRQARAAPRRSARGTASGLSAAASR